MGTAETTARTGARGGRTTARPARGTAARPTGRRRMGRGRTATPATSGGIGRLVEGFLRRR